MTVLERFTDRCRRILVLAQEEARRLDHSYIGTEDLLLGLLLERDTAAAAALFAVGLTPEGVRAQIQLRRSDDSAVASPPFSPRAKEAMELALSECLMLGHSYIGPEHLLLGLLRVPGCGAVAVIEACDVDPRVLRSEVMKLWAERREPKFYEAPFDRVTGRAARIQTLPEGWGDTKPITCSFCGKPPPASGRIIGGKLGGRDRPYICEHCVRRWAAWLDDEDGRDKDGG